MNARSQLVIDRVIGPPLVFITNIILHIVRGTFGRRHACDPPNVKIILVSKYLGYGSIIQATPLLRSLKTIYKNARLVFISTRKMQPIIDRIGIIDEAFYVDDDDFWAIIVSSFKLAFRLLCFRADIMFDLEVYSAYSCLMVALSRAPQKVGFYRKSLTYRYRVYSHLVFFNAQQHIMDIYLRLLSAIQPFETDLSVNRLAIKRQDQEEACRLLSGHQSNSGKYVIVNVNASELLLQRRWPADNYITVIERIVGELRKRVVLIGSKRESEYVGRLYSRINKMYQRDVINLSGKTSMGGLIYLIDQCELLLTNDSGPMHIAASLGKKVVALFGPVSPAQYAPKNGNCVSIYKNIYCSPCLYHSDFAPCNVDNQCMKQINEEEVFEMVKELLLREREYQYPMEKVAMIDGLGLVQRKGGTYGRV